MTPAQHIFCLAYVENGFNARAAYLVAHPSVTIATAGSEGHRTLNNPKVRLFLNDQIEAAHKPLAMGAQQALARLANIATFDVRELFDEQSKLLPVADWPDSVRSCIRGIQADGGRVTLESPLQALRTVLEIAGKVRSVGDSVDALADAIRADKARRQTTP
jgi:phage terminase small subunit